MPDTGVLSTHQRTILYRYHEQTIRKGHHAFDCQSKFIQAVEEQVRDGVPFQQAVATAARRHDEIVDWVLENVGLD